MSNKDIIEIAMLCCIPPERNTGMVTVDLSGLSFVERHFPNAKLRLYGWGPMGKYAYADGELPFEYLDVLEHSSRYLNADVRLIWGDFIQSAHHWIPDPYSWPIPKKLNVLEDVARVTFLDGASRERISNTFVFGSTIITNEAKDYIGPFYREEFERFFSACGGVLFRDALSAAKVSYLRPLEQTLGIDCVFLLKDSGLAKLRHFSAAVEKGGVGVFFGRTPRKIAQMQFALELSRELRQEAKWIPWFNSRRRMRYLAKILGFDIKGSILSPGEILSELTKFSFVITDTYHLCINAWRQGIPAVCIGSGGSFTKHSLSDKKKEILYAMYDARELYVFLEQIQSRSARKNKARIIAANLNNKDYIAHVKREIERHANVAESRLKNGIDLAVANIIASRVSEVN